MQAGLDKPVKKDDKPPLRYFRTCKVDARARDRSSVIPVSNRSIGCPMLVAFPCPDPGIMCGILKRRQDAF